MADTPHLLHLWHPGDTPMEATPALETAELSGLPHHPAGWELSVHIPHGTGPTQPSPQHPPEGSHRRLLVVGAQGRHPTVQQLQLREGGNAHGRPENSNSPLPKPVPLPPSWDPQASPGTRE